MRHAVNDRQLRQLHLQPRAVFRRAGRGRQGDPQRRDRPRRHCRAEARPHRGFARALHAQRGGRVGAADQGIRRPDSHPWRLPRTPEHWPGVRRKDRAREGTDARQDLDDPSPRCGRVQGAAQSLPRDALPLAGDRARNLAGLPGDHRVDRRRRDHGSAPQDAGGRGGAVPSRVHPHRTRPRHAGQFSEGTGVMQYKDLLTLVIERHDLPRDTMLAAMRALMGGEWTPAQIAGFLIALRMKGETVTEIAAAADVMRELSVKVPLAGVDHLVDTCGTGGDGAHTFNISTAAAFVAAACGARVAKHGGRSVSSTSGSADVLEALGVNLDLTPEQDAESIDAIGIGFMFAPKFHGAMKHAAPVRRALGVRTIFNILGPLTNPAGAPHQLLGVFHPDLVGILVRVLQRLGSRHAVVVYGKDGMDEVSLGAATMVGELKDGEVREYEIHPEDFGLSMISNRGLKVADAAESKAMVQEALGD